MKKKISMPKPVHLSPVGKKPLVSVLISNYNYADFLEKAVNSVLRQDYSNVEVIICDDGSTDGSIDLLRSFEIKNDSRIVILEQENEGQASAVNAAFQKSKGEIICFLDSDDLFYPEKISAIVQTFRKTPNAGFLVHRLDKVDIQNQTCGQLPLTSTLPSGWYGDYVTDTGSAPHGLPVTSGLVLRREIACRIFPVNENIVCDLDEIIRRCALLTTNVTRIESSLGAYRIHGENMTSANVHDRLRRNLPVYEIMWKETKTYLKTLSPEDAARFPGLEHDVHYLLMKYVLKRKKDGRRASREYWKKVNENQGFQAWPTTRKAFWHVAVHMPDSIFSKLVTAYWHTNGAKLQFSRIQHFFKKPFGILIQGR